MNYSAGRTVSWSLVALVSASLVIVAVTAVTAGPSPSCASAGLGSITESAEFTPAAGQRGPRPIPLRQSQLPDAESAVDELVSDAELDQLPLRLALQNGDGGLYRYFLDRPITETMTPEEPWAAGGVQLEKDSAEGGDFAAFLLGELGDRAVPIEIGQYRAALTWADPTKSDVRTHNLYWSDGESNYALIAVRAPEAIVKLARELVCGI